MMETASGPKALPPRRIMAIWLFRLATDRWRQVEGCPPGKGEDAEPVALIAETARGLRIDALNQAALDAGGCPGMMLADARAICPSLKVVRSDKAGDARFLEQLALWVQRWGPRSAVALPDGLLVDVTATAHLFGGEGPMLDDVQRHFAAHELATRVAIAPTVGAARALAHHGRNAEILTPRDGEARLSKLPVAALRLEADVLLVMRRLGLKTIGDVTRIGRDALRRRFRQEAPARNPLLRLDQMFGRLAEPLLPAEPVIPALVERRLLEPLLHRQVLDHIVKDLARDMAQELEGRGEGARRLELGLWRVDGKVVVRSLELAAATRDAGHIARLFAGRLDDVDAGFGIELVRMHAPWVEPLAIKQEKLDSATGEQGTTLAVCIDRLTMRLGADAIRRPVIHASHIPERAQRWVAPLDAQSPSQEELAFHSRPLKLLDRPEPISVLYATPDGYPRQFRWRGNLHEVVRVEGPERIAPEWWRERGSARLRDYYRIEDSQGRRYWIYRSGLAGDGRGAMPEWFLQGLCG